MYKINKKGETVLTILFLNTLKWNDAHPSSVKNDSAPFIHS